MIIKKAVERDLKEILALFDKTQTWLIEKGYQAQWGTHPFSENPGQVERFKHWLQADVFYVLRHDADIIGTLVIVDQAPEYAQSAFAPHPQNTLYLEAFATDPKYRGKGIGKMLLQWAEQAAKARGADRLRLDCWAENQALRKYYQLAGFLELGAFSVGEWQGIMFEKHADWLSNKEKDNHKVNIGGDRV